MEGSLTECISVLKGTVLWKINLFYNRIFWAILGVNVIESVDRALVDNCCASFTQQILYIILWVILGDLDGTEPYFSFRHIEAAAATFRV